MRVVMIVVGLLLLAARPAEACGFWAMEDKEKAWTIGFHINSGTVSKLKGGRVGAFYLDVESKEAKQHGIRVVNRRQIIFDIKDGKLRKFGKPVATIDGNTIMFDGKKTYTLELTNPRTEHDVMLTFDLIVRRDGNTIVESKEASSLCAGLDRDRPMTDADKEEEVRRRIWFYLAWRELGLTRKRAG